MTTVKGEGRPRRLVVMVAAAPEARGGCVGKGARRGGGR